MIWSKWRAAGLRSSDADIGSAMNQRQQPERGGTPGTITEVPRTSTFGAHQKKRLYGVF